MMRIIKTLVRGVCLIVVLPLFVMYQCARLAVGTRAAFQWCSQTLSKRPGSLGNYLREAFYVLTMERCSWDVCISFGTIFSDPRTRIGRGAYVGAYCCLGWVELGDGVLLASGVHVPSGAAQHQFDDLSAPIKEQGGHLACVHIGADTWIGERAVVMADVGQGCVVGAGSVVTKPIENRSVAVGNPARVIRQRESS